MIDMTDTSQKISKLEAQILRHHQQITRLKESERKQQTRIKIELGGLVFTAQLPPHLPDLFDRDGEARAIILGILAEATERLNDPQYRTEVLNRGRQIFASKVREKHRFLRLKKQQRNEK